MNEVTDRLPRIGVWSRELGQVGMPSSDHAAYIEGVESLGYRMLWFSEAFGREALSHAGLILSRSRRLIVGTGIANIWARDAVAMHNAGQTLGEAYPGRFVLGLGVSHDRMVEPRAHRFGSPLAVLRDYITQMSDAPYTGPPAPVPVPRVVGALGPRALELAGDLTDGAHPYLVTPQHTADARQMLGPDPWLAPEQGVILEEGAAVARAVARQQLSHYLEMTNYQRSFRRMGFTDRDLANGGSDRLVDAIFAWGNTDALVRRINEHLEAGADHVAIQVFQAHSYDDPFRTLEALAKALQLD